MDVSARFKALEYVDDSASPERYALSINLTVHSVENFLEQMRLIKEAFTDWLLKRQDDAYVFYFNVTASDELHTELDAWIKKIYYDEEELSPLLHAVDFHVAIANAAAEDNIKYVLKAVPRT